MNLKSSVDTVAISSATVDGVATINALASIPVTLNAHDGRLNTKVAGRWNLEKNSGDFDELRLRLAPADNRLAGAVTVAIGAKGTIDLGNDELALMGLEVAGGKAIAVGADGVKIHGLQSIPWSKRTADVSLLVDTYILDQSLAYWYGMTLHNLGGGSTLTSSPLPTANA